MGVYKNYIVKNARIWDGNAYVSGDLSVSGNKIVGMGESVALDNAEIIDACGKLITPGLIDIHTHIKNISNNTFGNDASLCTIPFGVTAAVDGGACKGNSEYLDTLIIDSAVFVAVDVKDDELCLENVEERVARYKDYFAGIKIYLDTSSPNVKTINVLKKACAYADEKGYRIMVHTTGTPAPMTEVVDILRVGDILTHAYHGGQNNSLDEDFAAIFNAKEKGVVVDAGMACHVHTDFNVLKKAIEKGALPDTISTDVTRLSSYARGGIYGLTMCMGICRHLGMKEEDILRCVTTNAARVMNRPDWGVLKVGGDATFAILDTNSKEAFSVTDKAGNHFEGDVGYKCVLTAIKGEIVYRM